VSTGPISSVSIAVGLIFLTMSLVSYGLS